MKLLRPLLALLPCLFLAMCQSIVLPPNSCDSATASLNVGPFFSQRATIAGAVKQTDGTIRVGTWQGSTSYLGVVNFQQEFHNLTVLPTQAAPVTVAAAAAPAH